MTRLVFLSSSLIRGRDANRLLARPLPSASRALLSNANANALPSRVGVVALDRLSLTSPRHFATNATSTPSSSSEGLASEGFLARLRAKRLEDTKKATAAAAPEPSAALISDQQAQEEKLLEFLSLKDTFTLADMRDYFQTQKDRAVAAQNSRWQSYIPGFTKMQGLEQLERFIGIFNNFSPTELNNAEEVRKIKPARRLKIARDASAEPAEIDTILTNHQSLYSLNQWARGRVLRGEYVPKSLRDAQYMMAASPAGVSGMGRRPAGFIRAYHGRTRSTREKHWKQRQDVFRVAPDRS